MAFYDFYGNVISFGGTQLNVKKNNPAYVAEFLAVARSYLGKTDIEYDDGNTIFYKSTETHGIDCSTFVGLCMMGLAYEDTPYYTGNYVNPDNLEANANYDWALPVIKYKVLRYIDGYEPQEMAYAKTGGRQARWMVERGLSVPMTNGFRDVEPGDIVCWGRKRAGTDEWLNPNTYLHMNHIAIINTKEAAPNTYTDINGNTQTWDKSKYPFKHTVIEVTAVTPSPCINTLILENGMENPLDVWHNNVNTVVAILRPDMGALAPST